MALHDYPYPSYDWGFQGVDFAHIPMTQALADAMYNDGIRIVGRYIYPTGKGITAQEARYYINAGINIYFYYEVDTSDALGGYNRGLQNGASCLAEAFIAGVPLETQIYCCCDTGVFNLLLIPLNVFFTSVSVLFISIWFFGSLLKAFNFSLSASIHTVENTSEVSKKKLKRDRKSNTSELQSRI